MKYTDEDLLMLSGIQHIAFCERQYALAYIELQWSENALTVEGHHMHEKVDDPFASEISKDKIILRALPLTSYKLGLYGRADVVELLQVNGPSDKNSIALIDRSGHWKIIPVEYKRGKPKPDERDEVQLCAQAICLEEMYNVAIVNGFLFYGETRHRHEVVFDEQLRVQVAEYADRMHTLFSSGITPPPVYKPHCKSCSLVDICLPKSISEEKRAMHYLDQILND